MSARPVVHFEIVGRDGAKLQEFYRNLFEWKIDANNPMNYGMVEAAGERGIAGGVSQGGGPLVTLYVEVADLAVALKKAESMGAKTLMPPTDIPDGPAIAQFFDPEGNVIGLVKAMA